ncbi:methyltransferase domain-containing protein [Streptomyces sp900105245]|uniref:Protein-L-isoaspartate O-methyltransferase n=1 Tax=Streptomyces sp. 900105245 TaxID=3154379 RepID=A0ABV1UIX1_9ACTN
MHDDTTLITQLDGRVRAVDLTAPTGGEPTSSSTLPSLVLRMWQQLGVTSGQRVLEIGTGAGYSTALGCHRLGDANVTSIEVDEGNAQRAAAALKQLGYAPTLIVGDGLDATVINGDYDALIATCAVRHIPYGWLDQVGDGGTVLATLGGWMGAYGLVKLTVTGRGHATGRFLPGTTSFMIARPHGRPPRPPLVCCPAIGWRLDAVGAANKTWTYTSSMTVPRACASALRSTWRSPPRCWCGWPARPWTACHAVRRQPAASTGTHDGTALTCRLGFSQTMTSSSN